MIEQELASYYAAAVTGLPLYYGLAPQGAALPYVTFIEVDDPRAPATFAIQDSGTVRYRFNLFYPSSAVLDGLALRERLLGALKGFDGSFGDFRVRALAVELKQAYPAEDHFQVTVDGVYDYFKA